MCPLLWCRTSFNDLAAVEQHVHSCPCLSDGLYWCPSCQRPERFTASEFKPTAISHAIDPGKETKFQRAVTFFKKLGHRKHGRSRSSMAPGVGTYDEYPINIAYTGDQICELEDRQPVELDSRKLHELGDEPSCVTPMSFAANDPQHTSSTQTSLSWKDEGHAAPSLYSPSVAAFENRTSGAHAQTGGTRPLVGTHKPGNQALTYPVSLTRNSPILNEKNAGESSKDLCNLQSPKAIPSVSQSTQQILRNDRYCIAGIPNSNPSSSFTSPPSAYEAEDAPSRKEPAMTKVLICELYDAVRAMDEEWIRRLALCTNVPQLNSETFTRALFKLGINALIDYFHGVMPSSFPNIFAFTHVAIASISVVHKHDDRNLWNAVLEEACQWQDLLSDVIEKGTFIKVMGQLCHPRGSNTPPSFTGPAVNNVFLPAENAKLVGLLSNLSTDFDGMIRKRGDQSRQGSLANNERTGRPGISRSGVVINGCTDFLDSKFLCHRVSENDCSDVLE